MATQQAPQSASEDDFFIVEDIDLSDESELRNLVAEVQALLGSPGRGLRISVLTGDQWNTVVSRWLKPHQRRGALYHAHALRDPEDGQHLAVSPSGVRGINERQANMYEELIYWLLRCIPTPLPQSPLRAGVEDVVAGICGRKVGVELYARHAPREAELVRALISVLRHDWGRTESDWALLLRRSPDRFFLALRKSKFCARWLGTVNQSAALKKRLASADNKRDELIAMLRDENLRVPGDFVTLTEQAVETYISTVKTK